MCTCPPVKSRYLVISLLFISCSLMSCSGGGESTAANSSLFSGEGGAMGNSSALSAGALDGSFGSNGIVVNSHKPYNLAESVVVQPDGCILVLDDSCDGKTSAFALIRYSNKGVLDQTFNNSGTVYGPFSSANSLLLQSDGKILVAGEYYNGAVNNLCVIRYNQDGSIDTGFGSGGIVQTTSDNNEFGCKIAIQSDGKIIVAGNESIKGENFPFLMRLNIDGTFDTAFGAGTSDKTFLNPNGFFSSLTIGSNNEIFIATVNYSQEFIGLGFNILKFTCNGLTDSTFGNGGLITDSLPVGEQYVYDLVVQSDGKLIAALTVDNLHHGGVIVTTSLTSAILHLTASSASVSSGLSPWLNSSVGPGIALVRYQVDGTRDIEFGSEGAAMYTAGSGGVTATAVVIQSDGKFTLTGQDDNNTGGFAVMRLNSDGSIDRGFGVNGMVTTAIGVNGGVAYDLALQQKRYIVVVGTSYEQDGNYLALVRYHQ